MNLIVAVTKNYGIGKNGKMLVHLPADLKYYKEKTIGNVVVMGLKTYYSLPIRPLPNRTTIVLTRNKQFIDDKIIVVNSLDELFNTLQSYDDNKIYICGGANIYEQLIDYCDTAYITEINTDVDADTFFPNISLMKNWKLVHSTTPQIDNNLEFIFKTYKNNKIKQV